MTFYVFELLHNVFSNTGGDNIQKVYGDDDDDDDDYDVVVDTVMTC